MCMCSGVRARVRQTEEKHHVYNTEKLITSDKTLGYCLLYIQSLINARLPLPGVQPLGSIGSGVRFSGGECRLYLLLIL